MKGIPIKDQRNLAVIGHGACGKTSLCEALLFTAGASKSLGTVEAGSTVMDFEPEEVARRKSLSAGFASLTWKKHGVHLVDTPGDSNFIEEARSVLQVLDGALLVISGVAGVEPQTEKVWSHARRLGVPGLAFINMMDRENADFDRAVSGMEGALGVKAVALQIPIGRGEGFRGAPAPPRRDRVLSGGQGPPQGRHEGEALAADGVERLLGRAVAEPHHADDAGGRASRRAHGESHGVDAGGVLLQVQGVAAVPAAAQLGQVRGHADDRARREPQQVVGPQEAIPPGRVQPGQERLAGGAAGQGQVPAHGQGHPHAVGRLHRVRDEEAAVVGEAEDGRLAGQVRQAGQRGVHRLAQGGVAVGLHAEGVGGGAQAVAPRGGILLQQVVGHQGPQERVGRALVHPQPLGQLRDPPVPLLPQEQLQRRERPVHRRHPPIPSPGVRSVLPNQVFH